MKISILTPSYNSEKCLERAIQSVIHQDYDNWEHIIVDGGSSDNTVEILNKYEHLKWISEADQGQSDAMNKAFEISEGDLIVYLNSDDEFSPDIFKKVVDYFEKNPQSDFVFGELTCVYPDGEQIKASAKNDLYEILDYWPPRFPLNSICYFYKRKVQVQIGQFPVNNHFTMDYWFLLRVYKAYKINYLPVNLGNFYFFDNKSSDINRAKKSLKAVRNQFFIKNPIVAMKYFIKLTKLIPYSIFFYIRKLSKINL